MTLVITIQTSGLQQAQANIQKIMTGLSNPTKGLENATHGVAGVFAKNYDSEGESVGGWADLSDYAGRIREWQGFDKDHPILYRYGTLRAVAVDYFQRAAMGSTETKNGEYTWSDQTVTGSLEESRSGNEFTASLILRGSYKLLNQFGHPNAFGYDDVPARPYWFASPESTLAAREGVVQWLQDDVLP